jgi:hypothetical protein
MNAQRSDQQSYYHKCIEAGAVGGIGAIPGTLAAHCFDVVKVRQQLTSETFLHAVGSVYKGGTVLGGNPSQWHFFAGAAPAVKQKVVTRTPMFLVSTLSVQFFESNYCFSPTSAAFVGSAFSGYVTGSFASPWEWQKVLVSQRIDTPAVGRGVGGLLKEAVKAHRFIDGLASVGRRVHAAGVRNAVFDSTFFGVKRIIEDWADTYHQQRHHHHNGGTLICAVASAGTGFAYGVAALSAVVVDYAVDVAVKRMYALGPERPMPSLGVLRYVVSIVAKDGLAVYRGLGVKSAEFGVSYVIPGLMAAYVVWGVERVANEVSFVEEGPG